MPYFPWSDEIVNVEPFLQCKPVGSLGHLSLMSLALFRCGLVQSLWAGLMNFLEMADWSFNLSFLSWRSHLPPVASSSA